MWSALTGYRQNSEAEPKQQQPLSFLRTSGGKAPALRVLYKLESVWQTHLPTIEDRGVRATHGTLCVLCGIDTIHHQITAAEPPDVFADALPVLLHLRRIGDFQNVEDAIGSHCFPRSLHRGVNAVDVVVF